MPDSSYFNVLYTKNWSCPCCVPILENICSKSVNVRVKAEIISAKLLRKLVKIFIRRSKVHFEVNVMICTVLLMILILNPK